MFFLYTKDMKEAKHTVQVPFETLRRLRIIAAFTGETYAVLLGRLVHQEFHAVPLWAEEVAHESQQEGGTQHNES